MKKTCLLCGTEFNGKVQTNNFCKMECFQRYAKRQRKDAKQINKFNHKMAPSRYQIFNYKDINSVDGDE